MPRAISCGARSKFVAAIGVHDLVVVETPDALLICPRDRAQDVGKIVKSLEQRKTHSNCCRSPTRSKLAAFFGSPPSLQRLARFAYTHSA